MGWITLKKDYKFWSKGKELYVDKSLEDELTKSGVATSKAHNIKKQIELSKIAESDGALEESPKESKTKGSK